jgi:TetR/AcrR family transcriptional regulator, cholesterol catabolism regulator
VLSSSEVTRRTRRRLTTEERRQEIVTTAAELFDRAGYSNTTMEDIARAVGVAKPTLYHYFPSKDEILFGIHEEFIDLLIRRHEQRLRAGLGPDQQLLEVMADILELMETHRGHVRVFFEHYRELPTSQQETIRLKRDRYERMVEEIFVSGVQTGVLRPADPKLQALAMFGMCNWAYQWYRSSGSLRTREIAYSFWSFLIHGIAASRDAAPTG